MEDQQIQEAENKKAKEESFIERYRLKEYSQKNYLVCTYRFSVIEKVLSKYIFQSTGSEYSLNKLFIKFKSPSILVHNVCFSKFFKKCSIVLIVSIEYI